MHELLDIKNSKNWSKKGPDKQLKQYIENVLLKCTKNDSEISKKNSC